MADTAVLSQGLSQTDRGSDTGQRERRFFLVFAIICALTIFAGFSPSFYLKDVIHAPPPLSAMSRVHGVVFTAWVLLFVTQVALIDFGNRALHRRLGLLGAVLFGLVFAIGMMTAINAARLGHAPPGAGAPIVFFAVPFAGILGTGSLVVAALWNRAQRDYHMRFMLAALITMTPPATNRLIIGSGHAPIALPIALGIMDVLFLAAVLFDRRISKRVHPAFLWSAIVLIALQGFILWAYRTPEWVSMARWIIQT